MYKRRLDNTCNWRWFDRHKPRLHCHKSRGLDPGRARLGKKGGSVNVSTGLGPVLLSGGPSLVGRGRLGPGRARLGT